MADNASSAMLTPAQMALAAEDAAFAKATSRPLKSFLLGLTGGGYISLGFLFYITVQVGTADVVPWGIAKLIGGLVFTTGLGLVILTGAELFTSSTLTLTARASGRITWWQLLANWGVVYVANFIGALTIVALIFAAGTWRSADGGWTAVILSAASGKLNHTFLEALALGILCNLLVCLAVWAAYSGRSTTDKIIAMVLPISLFVAAGFEHSIANMFLVPLALVILRFADAGFWELSGIDPTAHADITWSSLFIDNLIPVTLGNIIGGGIMIGILFWTVFHLPGRTKP